MDRNVSISWVTVSPRPTQPPTGTTLPRAQPVEDLDTISTPYPTEYGVESIVTNRETYKSIQYLVLW